MNTAMYVTKKVDYLIKNLEHFQNCLVFAEEGIEVPDRLREGNCFVFCKNPKLSYARLANYFAEEKRNVDSIRKYKMIDVGYYIGENVQIGADAYIEPNCLIGHDVVIGANAVILSGSTIKNAIIGDNFFCNENAVIGASGFTMCEDENGNKYRIPTLGKVIIGNYVEIGACDNISAGGCGDTVIEDYVKIDALVHIGHDVHIHKNAELPAGTIVGGFSDIGEGAYIGINSSIKNRILVGNHSMVGMGSNVTRNVEAKKTVVGNPAREYIKAK
ncbi:MAG: hypothetical protein NC489_42055 [Ruminococcus flavefaciens]|nr:hypothetical protein [Ruminococcus flavefaciens]